MTKQDSSTLASPELQPGFEALQIRYVLVSQALEWELSNNPKRHDLGKLADSITENGFRDPPAFDSTLNQGRGGLVFGNGRTEALAWMEDQNRTPPRGIALSIDDAWVMPVLFGVDARSEAAAKRFSLDHNTLTMAGGDFTALDMSRMFDPELYARMLEELAGLDQLPLTVDGDDLEQLLQTFGHDAVEPQAPEGFPSYDETIETEHTCPKCGYQFSGGK